MKKMKNYLNFINFSKKGSSPEASPGFNSGSLGLLLATKLQLLSIFCFLKKATAFIDVYLLSCLLNREKSMQRVFI